MGKRKGMWISISDAAAIVAASDVVAWAPWLDQVETARAVLGAVATMASSPSLRCVRTKWEVKELLDVRGHTAIKTVISHVHQGDLLRFLERLKTEEAVRMLSEGRR